MFLLVCVEPRLDGLCARVLLVGCCEPRWLARKGPPYWGAKSEGPTTLNHLSSSSGTEIACIIILVVIWKSFELIKWWEINFFVNLIFVVLSRVSGQELTELSSTVVSDFFCDK